MNLWQKLKGKLNRPQAEQSDLQTAQVTATGRVLPEHPSTRIEPRKLKTMLEDAENGDLQAQHDLFLDIEEQDSSIAANIQTRKRAVLTLDWRIAEPRNATPQEEQVRSEIEEFFYQFTGLEDLLVDMMDAVGHGFSALEIIWQQREGRYYPAVFCHRPQSWFRLDKDDNLLLKTPDNQAGEPLQQFGWVVHIHKSRSTQLARMGLYRTLVWLYMFKHYSVHDFAEFLELYGMPIRIGKYGAGATPEEKRTLLRALAEIGHNAAGIMPESMNVELHEIATGTSAGNNPFLQMVDWCEKSIARMILGQTLTSGADGKSSTNALGNVHNEVRRDLLVSDAKQLAQTITKQIILPYLQINLDPNIDPARIPAFEFDTKEREDLSQYADALPKLVAIGMQVPESWAREKLGIPDAQQNEPLLNAIQNDNKADLNEGKKSPKTTALSATCPCGCGQQTTFNHPMPQALGSGISVADGGGQYRPTLPPTGELEQDLLDQEIDFALADVDFNAQLDPMVKQAVAVLTACDSYEQAFAALTALYPNLDSNAHQRYLTNALFISELLGDSNAKRGL